MAAQKERVRIAVLPVVVHSGEDPEYLRSGLADMLISRMEQAGVFEIVRLDDPRLATTRLTRAVEAGRDADADFVLFGSFTRFGDGASLDMQCAATEASDRGEPLREIFVHSGSIGAVIPDLQDLVGKIARFAVHGYEPLQAVSAPPAESGGRGADFQKLQARVQALEEAVRYLEDELANRTAAASEGVGDDGASD